MGTDVSAFVFESDDLAPAGLRVESPAPAEVPVELATPPTRALGSLRQARLTAELLGALGTGQGAARPRYRRGVQGLPGGQSASMEYRA